MSLAQLLAVEARAVALLAECVRRGHVAPGQTERGLSQAVFALADEMFGVKRYWHKRIVRAGANTLCAYSANPPDLTLQADDILYFDLGPVFEDWEADVGRTYVLGADPHKLRLAADVATCFDLASAWARTQPALTAAQLYAHLGELAAARGWELGHYHCGHLIGRFPHEQTEGDDDRKYLRADNPTPLRALGATGEPYQWILEVHFVDRARQIGGFHESVLVLDPT